MTEARALAHTAARSVARRLPGGQAALSAQRGVVIGAAVLRALYASRFAATAAHLLIDLFFASSGRLSALEGPLRYLGDLRHLVGLTQRTVDYFVYVGAATWVADQLAPGTWVGHAGGVGIRIIAIFYASRVLVELSNLFVREIFLGQSDAKDTAGLQRRQTLVPVAMGLLRYGIYFSGLIMVLRAADIDPTPLLAGAGVLGVAVGLGAQAFVGDIVAGFFVLFEDLLLVGDRVKVAGVQGVVEEVGVRVTKIRDEAGVLHAIPNGEVRKVANHSRRFVNAVIDVHVPYDEDPARVCALLSALMADALAEETGQRGPLEVKVQALSEGSVLLRVTAQVPPGRDEDIGDTLRARAAEGLRSAGVGAPRARRAVLIESALHIGAPVEPKEEEPEAGPPKLFEPPK